MTKGRNYTDLTAADIQKASAMQWRNFEDDVQACSSDRVHADFIIQRHVNEFSADSAAPILPGNFITQFLGFGPGINQMNRRGR